ncbi:MAG: T9SS type A sorting domain-containing protein [FCB group bacterium]|nr:T9SS type A sorting domain-containing protein [FCB group bacterium]MBL7120404.1 T9SS type A sorting domain-containing protein [Candidatus Neomarinimicrobiota bacterium]
MIRFSPFFLMCVLGLTNLNANEFYVAPSGSNTNAGTLESPFATIQYAVNTSQTGDVCIIRGGTYHEEVQISGKSQLSVRPFQDEVVILDGTIPISSNWTIHQGSIYKTTLNEDIWQLFVDQDEMVMARWPNARFDDGSVWNQEENWAHGDENASTNGFEVDDPHGDISLADLSFSVEGALAILNTGSFRSYTKEVTDHSQGSSTFGFDPVPESAYRTKHHYYFLEKKLEFLDQAGEWFYDHETMELYFWAPEDANPNDLNVRGKTQAYFFDVSNSNVFKIKRFNFFGTTIKINNSNYSEVDSCNFLYPSCYKRMLGVTGVEPEMTRISSSSDCLVKRCAFQYTDGSAIETDGGNNTIQNCYFYHIDYTVTDLSSVMTTMKMGGSDNIFRQNTVHKTGASSGINPGNTALVEYNDMYDTGYLQSDGAIIHYMENQQIDSETAYNWVHDSPKYGIRYDGDGDGHSGTMHHNVTWNIKSGHMLKGHDHRVVNNTSFNNSNNSIIVLIDLGGNEGTITRNNAADKIAGHRSSSYELFPVPGIYDHNWNGYITEDSVEDYLVDPQNYDFRPVEGSPFIDAGVEISGITDGYLGEAPDLGAYEYGGDFWKAGITWELQAFPVGIDANENRAIIPGQIRLEQNYPNPFNGNTQIRFRLEDTESIRLSVYSLTGQLVENLIDQTFTRGEHSIEWNPLNMSSGVYMIRLESAGIVQVKRCLLLK